MQALRPRLAIACAPSAWYQMGYQCIARGA